VLQETDMPQRIISGANVKRMSYVLFDCIALSLKS
jgi:hypothetical protein